MTMQAVEMVEAPAQLTERVSRLEGSSEQVSERLRDLTTQMEALRAELRLELATGLKAQTAATEALRLEMDRKFEAQTAQIEELRLELAAGLKAQAAATEALRLEFAAEMKAQREETNRRFEAQAAATEALRLELTAQTEALRLEFAAQTEALRLEFAAEMKAQREDSNQRFAEQNAINERAVRGAERAPQCADHSLHRGRRRAVRRDHRPRRRHPAEALAPAATARFRGHGAALASRFPLSRE